MCEGDAVGSTRANLRIFTENSLAQCKVKSIENSAFRFPYIVSDFKTQSAQCNFTLFGTVEC